MQKDAVPYMPYILGSPTQTLHQLKQKEPYSRCTILVMAPVHVFLLVGEKHSRVSCLNSGEEEEEENTFIFRSHRLKQSVQYSRYDTQNHHKTDFSEFVTRLDINPKP